MFGRIGSRGNIGSIIRYRDIQAVFLIQRLCYRHELRAMVGVPETQKPKKTAEGRTTTCVIKIQIIVNHLMNHDISEGLFIEVEVVGHKNYNVKLLDRLFPFSPAILKLSKVMIGMHETELRRSQLVVEVQLVALPEHMGHIVKICYHVVNISVLHLFVMQK